MVSDAFEAAGVHDAELPAAVQLLAVVASASASSSIGSAASSGSAVPTVDVSALTRFWQDGGVVGTDQPEPEPAEPEPSSRGFGPVQ